MFLYISMQHALKTIMCKHPWVTPSQTAILSKKSRRADTCVHHAHPPGGKKKWTSWNIRLSSSLRTQLNILSDLINSMKLIIWRCYLMSTSLCALKSGTPLRRICDIIRHILRKLCDVTRHKTFLSFGMANKQNFRAVRS